MYSTDHEEKQKDDSIIKKQTIKVKNDCIKKQKSYLEFLETKYKMVIKQNKKELEEETATTILIPANLEINSTIFNTTWFWKKYT